MSSVKTYVLAPNFSYHPNTSICVGDIIAYPDDPTKPLSSVPESDLKPLESHFDYENELSNQNTSSLRGSIWATFLETVSAKVGGGTSDELLTRYTVRRLETIYFKKQPTDEEAADRIKDKKVTAAINAGIMSKKPVFMITGLKIARGFQLSSMAGSTKNANAEVKAPITSEVGMGTDAEYSRQAKVEQKHRTGQDIVFAYQLHIISHKGSWPWKKDVDISVYKPSGALLSDDKKIVDEELVETVEATELGLREFDKELQVEAIKATDGICIILSEE